MKRQITHLDVLHSSGMSAYCLEIIHTTAMVHIPGTVLKLLKATLKNGALPGKDCRP